jgi:hypothetical protein
MLYFRPSYHIQKVRVDWLLCLLCEWEALMNHLSKSACKPFNIGGLDSWHPETIEGSIDWKSPSRYSHKIERNCS